MDAMTLLRAMSALDPADLEHALEAGSEQYQKTGGILTAPKEGILSVQPSSSAVQGGRWLRTGGIAAAAACLVMTASVLLYVHNRDAGLMVAPSVSGQLEEATEAVTAQTTASSEAAVFTGTAVRTETSAVSTVTAASGTSAVQTAETQPPETVPTQIVSQAVTQEQTPQTEAPEHPAGTTTVRTQTTPAASDSPAEDTDRPFGPTEELVYESEIPVLVAMGDAAGTLGSSSMPVYEMQQITDDTAIFAYLSGESPAVTLGSGSKGESVTAEILQNPDMLRIRWQLAESVWDSYGIQSAVLDGSGVLHLTIGMYNSGNPQPEAEWIYEAALLYKSGSMPPVRELELTLSYYADTTGIAQWLSYQASLDEDVYVQYRP